MYIEQQRRMARGGPAQLGAPLRLGGYDIFPDWYLHLPNAGKRLNYPRLQLHHIGDSVAVGDETALGGHGFPTDSPCCLRNSGVRPREKMARHWTALGSVSA